MTANGEDLYLRENVLVEPLNNRWYVSMPMIAPHTFAMYTKNSHVRILKSFVMSPDLHTAAAADPAMRGGPFVALGKDKVDAVRALLERTQTEQQHLVEFAEAVETLDEVLRLEGKGFSLEPLYERVPEPLKGYVELVYDLNNQPSIRFLEGMLYKSRYFDERLQSVSLSLVEKDELPFVLSTPRLEDPSRLEVAAPFSSECYDALFRMKSEPARFDDIASLLEVRDSQTQLLRSLFSTEPPDTLGAAKFEGEGVRVRYFGHACLLIEDGHTSILTDPLISYRYAGGETRFTHADLPDIIDYVLITHGHLDHVVLETLLQIRHKTRTIVVPRTTRGFLAEPSLKLLLRHLGFSCPILEVDDLEDIPLPNGRITAIPFLGEHHDLGIAGKSAYRLQLGEKSFLIAADSTNLEPRLYDLVYDLVGETEVLFLGMECDGAPLTWFYGPLVTMAMDRDMASSRLGSSSDEFQASKLVDSLRCSQAFVYAMGLEHWFGHILSLEYSDDSKQIVESNRFVANCIDKGIPAQRLCATGEFFF